MQCEPANNENWQCSAAVWYCACTTALYNAQLRWQHPPCRARLGHRVVTPLNTERSMIESSVFQGVTTRWPRLQQGGMLPPKLGVVRYRNAAG